MATVRATVASSPAPYPSSHWKGPPRAPPAERARGGPGGHIPRVAGRLDNGVHAFCRHPCENNFDAALLQLIRRGDRFFHLDIATCHHIGNDIRIGWRRQVEFLGPDLFRPFRVGLVRFHFGEQSRRTIFFKGCQPANIARYADGLSFRQSLPLRDREQGVIRLVEGQVRPKEVAGLQDVVTFQACEAANGAF